MVIRRRFMTIPRRAIWLLVLCAFWGGARPSAAAEPSEYQVKAAFLYKFVNFVEWPAAALPQDSSPLIIGVLGDDPFGSHLDKTVEGKTLDEHKIVVKRFKRLEELQSCHVLFVCRSEKSNLSRIIERLGKANTLVVGDMDNFLQQGAINFIIVERKVRFEINMDIAERAGLKISSKLLQLATKVIRR